MKLKKILFLMSILTFLLVTTTLNSLDLGSKPNFSEQIMKIPSNPPVESYLSTNSDNATLLNGSFVCYYEIRTYRYEAQNITFNYTDAETNQTIENASANFTWYKKTDSSINGNGTLIELGSGLYTLDFNTSTRDIGAYIISVNIEKENYTKPNMVVSLTIQPRLTTFLTLTGTMLNIERGVLFPLLFYLQDSINGTKLDGRNIKWTMGFLTGNLTSMGNGFYVLLFPSGIFDIGSNLMILDGTLNTDYNIPTASISLGITWEKIYGIDLPIFFAILVSSIIIIFVILSYLLYKRYSVPFVIRKINDSLNKIENEKRPISTLEIKSREEIYMDLYETDWENINEKPRYDSKIEKIE